MKVRELQYILSKLDPELDVLCYSEDENLLDENRAFILFYINSVDSVEAEMSRIDETTPYLKFVKSDTSKKLAILQITSDF